ncbi:MAG: hypothetical protein ABI539_04420, partial [Acidobacteriota bacterium]
ESNVNAPRAMRLGKRGPKLPGTDSPPPPPTAIAAPDNSVFTAVLTDVATEIRTFKDHPQLLKVEKQTGTDWSRIKVFLKDGRVIELAGDKINSLGTASAASILAAAGVSPTVTGRTGQQKRN